MKLTIVDLSRTETRSNFDAFDVCVVGAGAAGIYLAKRLAWHGQKVCLLEAGGMECKSPEHTGFIPSFSHDDYPGAISGRAFGVGGSTARWGGLLIPHSESDIRDSTIDLHGNAWQHIVSVIKSNTRSVLGNLGYSKDADFGGAPYLHANVKSQLQRAGLLAQAALFLPFRKKNFIGLLNSVGKSIQPITVLTNAVAKQWSVDQTVPEGTLRLASVLATSLNGKESIVSAKRFIVAAGAIESARILLEIKELPRGELLSDDIGRYLGDHLSVPIATVEGLEIAKVITMFAPRFQSSWMRSFRFLEKDANSDAPRAFTHFVFENQNPGFLLAKKVLTSFQARRVPRIGVLEGVAGAKGLLWMIHNRFIMSRLYVPPTTRTKLQLDMEQIPDAQNRVQLTKELDAYGRRKADIRWRISDADLVAMRETSARWLQKWNSTGVLASVQTSDLLADSQKPHDAYHPVGVCRMGHDETSVVDLNLKVRGTANLWCVSTGVFPTAGTANPTFSMLCLAEKLIEDLKNHPHE